ncbi:hypothetical protein Pmar_PMAR017230 [Perkinsus marinus ATCC 50983]|uniref:Uncharacterized protein n=1 Tax=Perkinsus marinus (strain ATCC 50983 / TXsc) TaxID=423536 RepID=C5KNB4_PERM5|nr:hypothetical protein Pmar_PMAR017230 [Perkinsus marinus ATCC 50983]EER14028.1 hypothetical protein Pmar_PMAR017230 [Perkinsus marinus ATCC 50983]|eukprot:XP_002782233.1 hypothetical protein Pmar_PMAR017230 [Perkinsus marinus ATCC 50983]
MSGTVWACSDKSHPITHCVSILSPFWPDVCFEGLEEDIEQSMEGGGGGGSPGDSNNGDEVSVEEDEYMKHVSRRNRKMERYLFGRNPTDDKMLREVHLGRARLVPDPTLICRVSGSSEWKEERIAEDNYKVDGIGPMDGIPKSLSLLSEAEQSFASATNDLLQNIPAGGLATIYQLLDLVANDQHGRIALLLIARFVQSTVDRFVGIGGIGSIPLRYMRLMAFLARGSVLLSAAAAHHHHPLQQTKDEDGSAIITDERFQVYSSQSTVLTIIIMLRVDRSLCSLVGSLARLALDTSLPQSMAQSAQGGGYPMSPILPPRGSQTPSAALGGIPRQQQQQQQHGGVAAAVCDTLQLVSFRDMCSKCFKECSPLVKTMASKLTQHVDLCVEDRWRTIRKKKKSATTRADLMALVSIMSLVKEENLQAGDLCSQWLEMADNTGEKSSSPPDVSEYERELSLVYLEQKAKLSDYFLATSLIRERMGIGDDRFNASFL